MKSSDTIAAIATPPGEGGLGVIRISGDNSLAIAKSIFNKTGGKSRGRIIKSHQLYFGTISGEKGATLDEVCLVYMKSPRSYTRQDTVEIYCHGSPAVLNKILELTLQRGARMAQSGEFTKRAFLNGRIDLSQAEGVIDLIKSRSETASQAALRLMQGGLSSRLEVVRENLVNLLSHLEASIDFPDEELETADDETLISRLDEAISTMERLVKSYDRGKRLKEGLKLVITGKPNAGKSSLLNAILEEERAIVTPHPGTTRDLVRANLELAGLSVELVDTAGLNPSPGEVEAMGIDIALRSARLADIVLGMFDGSRPWDESDRRVMDVLRNAQKFLAVVNKADLPRAFDPPEDFNGMNPFDISVKTRRGMDELMEKISALIKDAGLTQTQEPLVTRTRHLEIFRSMVKELKRARKELPIGRELAATAVWSALEDIKRFTGKSYTEEVLSAIFDEFCVGK